MSNVESLIAEHIDTWASAIKTKSSAGRGNSNKRELYGIKKLRKLILELAINGLLVPQISEEEPASVLLNKIAVAKKQLIENKTLKKQKAIIPIVGEKIPENVPAGWELARFGNVLFNRDAERIPLSVSERKTRQGNYDYYGASGVIDTIDDYLFDKPLLLIGEDGANLINRSTPIAFIAYGKYWVNNHAHVLDGINEDLLNFICIHINAISLEPYVTGTAQPKMNQAKMNAILLSIPPAAEQKRITAKVNELMAICDQLEQQTNANIDAHEVLVSTLLKALTDAATTNENGAEQFQLAWERIAENFDILFTTENSVEELKQVILQLAVRGKLVPQDPNDEPASLLLEKIAAEKEQLIKDKKIKKQKPLPEISDAEKPFELPYGWAWCRLQDSIDVRDGTHDSPKDSNDSNSYPLVTSKNFINGKIDFQGARKISEKDHLEISKRSLVEVDDILFSMIGGNIGNQVIVKDPRPFSIKNVALFKYYDKKATDPNYFKIFTEELAIELQTKASGGAQPFVSLGSLRKLVFALPPYNEQLKIVHKVKELFSICNKLSIALKNCESIQKNLADAFASKANK